MAVLLLRRVPPIDTEWYFAVHGFVLTKLTSSFFMKPLYYIRILCTSFTLLATYVRYPLCSLYKSSSVGDSKTAVGMYFTVICTLHYCSKDWGTNMLPTCPPRSKLVLSPASILSYEDHYVHSSCAVVDNPQLRQYHYDVIPPFRLLQADYTSANLGIQYDDSTVSFYAIPQMALTILTALMPFYKFTDTLW